MGTFIGACLHFLGTLFHGLFGVLRMSVMLYLLIALAAYVGWQYYWSKPEPHRVSQQLTEQVDRLAADLLSQIPGPSGHSQAPLIIDHFEGDMLAADTKTYLVRNRIREGIRSRNDWVVPPEKELPLLGKVTVPRHSIPADRRAEAMSRLGADAMLTGTVVARNVASDTPFLHVDLNLLGPDGESLWSSATESLGAESQDSMERIGAMVARVLLVIMVILMTPVILFPQLRNVLKRQSNMWNLSALISLTVFDSVLAWMLLPAGGSWLLVLVLVHTGVGFFWNGFCLDRWEELRTVS